MVVDAVCYTTWLAYRYEKQDYYPQSIEIVSHDDCMDEEFTEKIAKAKGYQEEWSESLKEHLLAHYPAGSDK